MKLNGKVALVTGGARGIGKAIALLFAQQGADIALCDVNAELLAGTGKEVEALGRRALTGAVDVTKPCQA